MASPPGRTHLPALTGLRFVAALLVVVFHFGKQHLTSAPAPILNVASTGYVSVGLFFVLSGFVLTYTYLDVLRGGVRDWRGFLVARFARIYPVYAIALLLATVYHLTLTLKSAPPSSIVSEDGVPLGLALSMAQAWTVKWFPLINTPGWSLSAEIFFYLLFPAAVFLLNRVSLRGLVLVLGCLWLLAMSGPAVYLALDPDGLHTPTTAAVADGQWLIALLYNPLAHLPEFLIGVATGRIFMSRSTPRWPDGGVLAGLAGLAILLVLANSTSLPYPLLNNGLLAPLFALLVYGLARGGGALNKALSLPVVVVLGEASYAMYILQEPVWKWSHTIAGLLTGRPAIWTEPGFFFIYVPLLLGISVASFYVIETPARRILRRWLTQTVVRSRRSHAMVGAEPVTAGAGG